MSNTNGRAELIKELRLLAQISGGKLVAQAADMLEADAPKRHKPVEIKVLAQGDAVCGTKGYMLKRSTSVAAFYLDGWGATGRIYPEFTKSSVWDGTNTIDYPSITISDGSDDGSLSEIYFPEYKGWRVHSVSGGKTAAICLVKEN